MAQSKNLIMAYDPNTVRNFIVGAADIVPYTLYVRDANGLLVQAGADDVGVLWMPLTAEKAGKPVAAALAGAGNTFIVTAGGAITRSAAARGGVQVAAGGVVIALAAGRFQGCVEDTAANTELCSVTFWPTA